MPEQDNIQTEKLSFSDKDFAEDNFISNDNDFGIQDTQLLANRDLQSFLLSDPDKVQNMDSQEDKDRKAAEEAKKQQNQSQQDNSSSNSKDKNDKNKKEDKPSGKEVLDKILFEEDDKTPVGTDKANPTKPEDVGDEDDTYINLGRDLLRLGVFSKNSEDETEENLDIKTGDQLLERFNLEKKKGAINIIENFLSQYGEDYRKMFDAVFVNGVSPQEYLQSFSKIEAIGNIDLSSESNQERVVKAYYKSLKWDDAKIENRISKLKDYGDLEDEAKTYHEVLLNKEKENAAALEQKKIQDAQEAKEKEAVTKRSYQRILNEKLKSQDFDGIPINQQDIEATINYMSEKKYKLQSGELLSEYDKDLLELNRPENHELKVKLGLLMRKKLDLTSVKKTTISKKSDAIFTLSTKNAKDNRSKETKETKSFFS